MIIPPYLKPGDTVALVATARKINKEELAPAVAILESYGLKVAYGQHLFKEHNQFAGTDSERAEDLQWAIENPAVKAIIIARGGYGSLRIADHVNFESLLASPKWIVGYSDVTVLHAALLKLGIACIHGTMLFQFSRHLESTYTIKTLLFGEELNYTVPPHTLNREGTATAGLTGGNLSLLYALASTPTEVDTEGKILFIEDLDEYLYHIDRMMLQLKRAGKLKGLKGLIVGGMSDMKDNSIAFGKAAEEIIAEAVKDYDYPVCFGFPAGHIERNLALGLGRNVQLTVSEQGSELKYV